MSNNTDFTQYNIEVSTAQPGSGAEYYVQLTLQQTSTFGDSEAVALLSAHVAAVPSGWTPVSAQLSKVTTDSTQWNWSSADQAFE
jgi:hypothetical protein